MKRHSLLASLLCLGALSACDRDGFWERTPDTQGPFALHQTAVWLVPGAHELFVYDPVADSVERRELGARPRQGFVSPDRKGMLVLDENDGADWIVFNGGRIGSVTHYALGAPFSGVTFAPDGQRAIVHHTPGTSVGDTLIRNPNQLAILDLTRPASAKNPVRRTLRSFGAEPRLILVSETMEVAGAERQLAWALSDRYLALFDLAAPSAEEVIVHLTLAQDQREVAPTEVVFGQLGEALTAFVRANGSDDLFALTFPESAGADEVPRPHLNQLPGGSAPSAIVARRVGDGDRLFALNAASNTLTVVDPATGHRVSVSLPAHADAMLPFTGPAADGEGETELALLWGGSSTVTFVDLAELETRQGRALTPLTLSGPVTDLRPLPDRRMAVALQPRQLTLLDFDARTATPLPVDGDISELLVPSHGDRFFALARTGDYSGGALLSVDVATGTPSSRTLEVESPMLRLIEGANVLLIAEPDPAITFTVASMTDAAEASLRERVALLLTEVLDR